MTGQWVWSHQSSWQWTLASYPAAGISTFSVAERKTRPCCYGRFTFWGLWALHCLSSSITFLAVSVSLLNEWIGLSNNVLHCCRAVNWLSQNLVAFSSLVFKLTLILVPVMLSHLLVHLPPLPLRSQIALFSMPRLISGINFLFHFVNQFHLFMLTSVRPSVLHFPHPSPLHSFTLNSKLIFLVNFFLIDLLP